MTKTQRAAIILKIDAVTNQSDQFCGFCSVFGIDIKNRLVILIRVRDYHKHPDAETELYLFLYSLIYLTLSDL